MLLINKIIEALYLRQKNNLVYYDSMTRVKSRMYYDRVAKTKYLNKKCMVIFVDINCLKMVNDTKGHTEGNVLIETVAQELNKCENVYDVCRIGGDEFIMFASPEFDTHVLNNIKQISYGFYVKDVYEEVSSAVKKADEYMYNRKRKMHKRMEKYSNENIVSMQARG